MDYALAGALIGTAIGAALGVTPRACLISLGLVALIAVALQLAGVVQ